MPSPPAPEPDAPDRPTRRAGRCRRARRPRRHPARAAPRRGPARTRGSCRRGRRVPYARAHRAAAGAARDRRPAPGASRPRGATPRRRRRSDPVRPPDRRCDRDPGGHLVILRLVGDLGGLVQGLAASPGAGGQPPVPRRAARAGRTGRPTVVRRRGQLPSSESAGRGGHGRDRAPRAAERRRTSASCRARDHSISARFDSTALHVACPRGIGSRRAIRQWAHASSAQAAPRSADRSPASRRVRVPGRLRVADVDDVVRPEQLTGELDDGLTPQTRLSGPPQRLAPVPCPRRDRPVQNRW